MRWLIVGPYPPEQGSGPAAAAGFVAQRLAAGDSVHAVSPRPSAAHEHLPLTGLRAIWALWRTARAHQADGIWLRVESGIVLRGGVDRRRALVERAALALLLRSFAERVLDVGDVGLLPGGRAGRPVLAAASRFVVHSDRDAAALSANGAPAARIELAAAPAAAAAAPAAAAAAVDDDVDGDVDYPPPSLVQGLPGDRAAIEAAVRARAAQLHSTRKP